MTSYYISKIKKKKKKQENKVKKNEKIKQKEKENKIKSSPLFTTLIMLLQVWDIRDIDISQKRSNLSIFDYSDDNIDLKAN